MKIESVTMISKSGSTGLTGFGQNENKDARIARMQRFWSDKANAVIHPVGLLLASVVNGKTLAEYLVAGEEVELAYVTVGGKKLHSASGSFKLSLGNIKTWACPACSSAHGSGVYPSREADSKGLAGNRFYFRPSDGALFVISDTCWVAYCKRLLGESAAKRFVAPTRDVVFAQVVAPRQVTA